MDANVPHLLQVLIVGIGLLILVLALGLDVVRTRLQEIERKMATKDDLEALRRDLRPEIT